MEADGTDNQQKTLKAMSWPLMDDPDALASSYISKILTCLSKWSVKMQTMVETLNGIEHENGNLELLLPRIAVIQS